MNFPLFLSTAALALGLSSLTAGAATVYEAAQTLTLTVVQGDDDVAITYDPDDPFVTSFATGDFPTFASAAALGTASEVTLTRGSSFTLEPSVEGLAGDNLVSNVSEAVARNSGTLTLENTSQMAAQIIFDILFDMTWLATVDDPLTDTATAEVFFEILLGSTTLFSRQFNADTVAGLPGGSASNTANTLQLVVELDAFETEEYTIRATSMGRATTTPSLIPLPAAGWLLIAGLGGLALAGRRKAA